MSLARAEFLKLRTTRAWLAYVPALCVISGIGAAARLGTARELDFDGPDFSRELLMSSLASGLIAFLVGITAVTGEWRYGTITRTFLVTPRRERVLVAKEIVVLLVGAALAALAIVVVLAVAVPWLAAEGSSFALDGGVLELFAQLVLAAALWGALGAGVGALVQSQTSAVVIGLFWVLILEALIEAVLGLVDLEALADFQPGYALSAFVGDLDSGLSPWAGGAVALGWVLGLGALGCVRMIYRNVT
jgi:ABC-type transport system involved in multi-copper enzyme maturation permease subunit